MTPATEYTPSEHTVKMNNKDFKVRSLTPKLTEEKRSETKQKIENDLYHVFSKYIT